MCSDRYTQSVRTPMGSGRVRRITGEHLNTLPGAEQKRRLCCVGRPRRLGHSAAFVTTQLSVHTAALKTPRTATLLYFVSAIYNRCVHFHSNFRFRCEHLYANAAGSLVLLIPGRPRVYAIQRIAPIKSHAYRAYRHLRLGAQKNE